METNNNKDKFAYIWPIKVNHRIVSVMTLSWVTVLYVTEPAKRGLQHTFILPTLTIHNLGLVKAIDLQCGQKEIPT